MLHIHILRIKMNVNFLHWPGFIRYVYVMRTKCPHKEGNKLFNILFHVGDIFGKNKMFSVRVRL